MHDCQQLDDGEVEKARQRSRCRMDDTALALGPLDTGREGANGFAFIEHDTVAVDLLSSRIAAIVADAGRTHGLQFSEFLAATIRTVNGVSEYVIIVRAATSRSQWM